MNSFRNIAPKISNKQLAQVQEIIKERKNDVNKSLTPAELQLMQRYEARQQQENAYIKQVQQEQQEQLKNETTIQPNENDAEL